MTQSNAFKLFCLIKPNAFKKPIKRKSKTLALNAGEKKQRKESLEENHVVKTALMVPLNIMSSISDICAGNFQQFYIPVQPRQFPNFQNPSGQTNK